MDPVSIGLAFATLLAVKASDGFLTEAGADAWRAARQLAARLRDRLSGDAVASLDRIDSGSGLPSDIGQFGQEVQQIIAADPALKGEVERIIKSASGEVRLAVVINEANDQARQINITGDSHGTINMGDS